MTMHQQASIALIDDPRLPWATLGPGIQSKTLALFRGNTGWISLLRLEPGTCIPLHRHTGEVHGFVLSGRRCLEPSGPAVSAGDYDFEPAGQIDSWYSGGDAALLSQFIVRGSVEYLDSSSRVIRAETTASKLVSHERVP